ncbi:hypothetical protein YC2023_040703 [Brassica napus]
MIPSLSGEVFSFEEFDIDFEFDAPRFYDFSRPELDSETEEIEFWFESAGNYPPSRKTHAKIVFLLQSFVLSLSLSLSLLQSFSPKCNWKLEPLKQITNIISETKPVEISKPVIESGLNRKDQYNGFIYYNQTVKDVSKTKPKSKTKSCCSSTLTRPTASLLARQNKPLDVYSVQLLTRCQRSLAKFGGNLSPILDSKLQNKDTKRPKLEAKVSRVNSNRRSKLTVPKEPNLRTAERSERHRSKLNSETEQNAKPRISSSKRNTTNKNIKVEPCSTPLPKSNTPRSQDLLQSSLAARIHFPNNILTYILCRLKPTKSPKGRLVKGNHSSEKLGEPSSIKYGTPSSYRTDINSNTNFPGKQESKAKTL